VIDAEEARRRTRLNQRPPQGFPVSWAHALESSIDAVHQQRKGVEHCFFTPALSQRYDVGPEKYEAFVAWVQELGFAIRRSQKRQGMTTFRVGWDGDRPA
jgi:hypothetical protein